MLRAYLKITDQIAILVDVKDSGAEPGFDISHVEASFTIIGYSKASSFLNRAKRSRSSRFY